MAFCKEFNAASANIEPGLPIPVVITVFNDKSFTFVMKSPPATVYCVKQQVFQKVQVRLTLQKLVL